MFKEYAGRLFWLLLGQVVSSIGVVMMLQANIGLEPWSVLQQGMSQSWGITYGTASAIVGVTAIVIAVLCGEKFGFGMPAGIFICAICIDWLLARGWIPKMETLPSGILMLLGGLEMLVLGTWLYLKAALGGGPRDALMIALIRKTGHSAGFCRVMVELIVIITGYLLGGQIGVGTIIATFGFGSLLNLNFHLLRFHPERVQQENIAETIRRICGKTS